MDYSERLTAYVNSLYSGNTPLLDELEAEAKRTDVPVIRRDMQSLLRTLLQAKSPGRILEVGTATGFSTIFMCTYCERAHVTTIEKYDKRILTARENFKKARLENRITLMEGEALDILEDLSEDPSIKFDFVFMDAAKAQYINFLPFVMSLLKPGGILLSDNVLQDGLTIESRFAVSRRDRTIHSRMRDYLYELTHDENLFTAIINTGDGAAISVRKDETRYEKT